MSCSSVALKLPCVLPRFLRGHSSESCSLPVSCLRISLRTVSMDDLSNLTEKKEKLYSPQKALGSSFCNVPSSPCLQQPKQDTKNMLDLLNSIVDIGCTQRFFTLNNRVKSHRSFGPIPNVIEREPGHTLDMPPVYCRANAERIFPN